MTKAPLVTAIAGVVAGMGLIVAGSASNGFRSCGTGGGKYDSAPGPPCPHATAVLDIAGVVVSIAGILLPLALNAAISRRANKRIAPPARPDDGPSLP